MSLFATTFDSVFWLGVLGALCGGCGLGLKYFARARCAHLKCCWGAIDLERNVVLEEHEEELRMAQQMVRSNTDNENTIAGSPRSMFSGLRAVSTSARTLVPNRA